ncbi:MAG: efflux RND transporter permease subunit, partial [Pseudomonadota bacterium]
MKTVGLLGGMSWESSLGYYRAINEGVKQALGGLHSARIAMVSVDFQPIEQLQANGDWAGAAACLVQAARQVEDILLPFKEEGVVDTVFTFTGWGNRAWRSFVVWRMAPWDERDVTSAEVATRLIPQMGEITIARGFPVTPSGLGLRGNSSPVRVVITGPDFETVRAWSETLLERSENIEGLVDAELNFELNLPQLDVSIDRAR